MHDAGALETLVQSLKRLPGVGVKSAQRIAYHLLQHERGTAVALSRALAEAVSQEKLGKLTAGMPLPPGMKFPF